MHNEAVNEEILRSVGIHPVYQGIKELVVYDTDTTRWGFAVGEKGVTRIEQCYKAGEYVHIPYFRVWKGDKAFAEFCQHKIVGIIFDDGGEEVFQD